MVRLTFFPIAIAALGAMAPYAAAGPIPADQTPADSGITYSEAWLEQQRAQAEAARLRFFSNETVSGHVLGRRATVRTGRYNLATGARSGPNNVQIVDCGSTNSYKIVSGDGLRFFSNNVDSGAGCRLHQDGGEWPIFRQNSNDYVIITVLMRGSSTVGKNSYFSFEEPQCSTGVTNSNNACGDELDVEIYAKGSGGETGAVVNAFKKGRAKESNWHNSLPGNQRTLNNINDPTTNFYAYTFYVHDGFMSVGVSDTSGNRKDIRECAGGSGCPFAPRSLVGAYIGIWDCSRSYCGPSQPAGNYYSVVREIYWEQFF
ncbi:hypothetical protein BJ742DRAFT_768927 [Cladochytrium replicatum]|nr:hypothetical protein BJ742DRAFT_768927 [Cladochytrium replicatum]